MITWRIGTVVSHGSTWGTSTSGARELHVQLDTPLPGRDDTPDSLRVRALAYTTLVGHPAPGDRLLLNCSALARGLGTGGYALVVADDLDAMPVVVADLHSALPAIVAGARHAAHLAGRPAPRIAYVMTDGAALPAAFSRTIATLRDTGWLHTTITVGQAFGGDLEAVTVHTGLLAAHRIAHADITVITQGPGNLGTGTRWGYSGVAAGEAVNATATLGGRPVASLRVSGADPRDRHLGISHHSLTAYGRVALAPADIPVPHPTPDLEALPAWGTPLTRR
ncbi:DUF3866 domain-containing protein, partial [Xylanimonas oleitrophica]